MSKIIEALKRAEEYRATSKGNGPPGPGQGNGVHGSVTPTATNVSIAPLDQAMVQIRQELQESEQQAARQAAEQVRLKTQLASLSQVVAQVEQERTTVQAQLERVLQDTTTHKASRALLTRQLEALRACQTLASDVRIAEQEAQASRVVVTTLTQSAQRISEELAHQTQRAEQSQQRVSQLKFKLAQAFAATGIRGTLPEDV